MKTKRYWLRGAGIGLILGLLFAILKYIVSWGLYHCAVGASCGLPPNGTIIFGSVLFFILFILLGWIYGKLKK